MKQRVLLTAILLSIAGLLLFPRESAEAVAQGLRICAWTLIPALFPYLFLSALLAGSGCGRCAEKLLRKPLGRLFGIGNSGASVWLIGLVGGYPSAAAAAAQLRKHNAITKEEADGLLFFCCNAGPAFIAGVIGNGLFHSKRIGTALLLIHYTASFLCGLLHNRKKYNTTQQGLPDSSSAVSISSSVVRSLSQAVATMLNICGYVCVFSLILRIISSVLVAFPIVSAILAGMTELSAGMSMISLLQIPWTCKFILTAAMISFGGLCVLLQTASVLEGTGLSLKCYIQGKLLQSLFSAVLAWPVSFLVKPNIPVSTLQPVLRLWSPWPWTIYSIVVVLVIFLQFPPSNSERHRI